MWTLPYAPHPGYAQFKGVVYGRIDRRMQRFFSPNAKSLIRLDEIDWGGVTVNGIPPLYYPKVLKAADASFFRDSHVVQHRHAAQEQSGDASAHGEAPGWRRGAACGDRGRLLEEDACLHVDVAGRRLLVVTSKAGANRVYDLSGHDVVFQSKATNGPLVDTTGRRWTQTETARSTTRTS